MDYNKIIDVATQAKANREAWRAIYVCIGRANGIDTDFLREEADKIDAETTRLEKRLKKLCS